MTPKERAAMQQALEALDVLLTEPMAKTAADKAEALLLRAAPAMREALAEQEPVAWYSDKGGFNECGEGKPLYAAPVRTKDLTDEEITTIGCAIYGDTSVPEVAQIRIEFARAAIAADREKNK